MGNFNEFREKVCQQIVNMSTGATRLFITDVDPDKLWELYLDSFPPGTNNVYRVRREHDCSSCRSFVKRMGGVVAIKNGKVSTLWDIDMADATYQPVADAMSEYVKSKPVTDVFISRFATIGNSHDYEMLPTGLSKRWEHLFTALPSICVERRRSAEEVKAELRDTRNVFRRSLEEITEYSILTVLELIAQNSLYRGTEWKGALETFLKSKREYLSIAGDYDKSIYLWEKAVSVGAAVGRIRNHSMGTLLVNISEGMELDEAVRKYEAIVAPANYKRPKAIFTQKMLDEAQKTIEELGLMNSLGRRFANLDDITANNILFSNKDSAKRISGASMFDDLKKDISVSPKKFSRVDEVSIDKFVSDVLPSASTVELLFEGRHTGNLMSLIAPQDKTAPSMFKWENGFSWAYSGNIADSVMRENVKAAGGSVDGVLRFSIQWNDGSVHDGNDLDAHCIEPRGNEIYFGNKVNGKTSGNLDVDIINPTRGRAAVENITWGSKNRMGKGKYTFFVHCYTNRGGRGGFNAEIEFDGQIYTFCYNKPLRPNEKVEVAVVTFDGESFSIDDTLPCGVSNIEVWGIHTNQFVPVSVICYSPNYWDEQTGVGNKHYFFMLKDCVNHEKPNGIFNEYLKEDLLKHKRVFEALGSHMAVVDANDQLSGVGFSSTKRDDIIVRVTGATSRILKIKF